MSERFSTRTKADIERLVYTEGTYVNNMAMMKPFEDIGLYDEYEYVSVIDSRTSVICSKLDGQRFKLVDKKPGVNFPPMHPRCRSTFSIVIPDNYSDRYVEKFDIKEQEESKTEVYRKSQYPYMNNVTHKYVDGKEHEVNIKISTKIIRNGKTYLLMDTM